MTEIDFLIELILEHKLGRLTKDRIRQRLKEVQRDRSDRSGTLQELMQGVVVGPKGTIQLPNPTGVPQSASTLRAIARQAEESGAHYSISPVVPAEQPIIGGSISPIPEPEPVKIIAHTPAAMAAVAARAQAIASAGKPNPETGRPRKF